ncbi:hypothetical protein LCGC14_2551430, partial [marine sediment metagenome]
MMLDGPIWCEECLHEKHAGILTWISLRAYM